jgi:hypothetical protein
MRKTLFAMLGLVALGLWALPALAAVSNDPQKDPPKASLPIDLENRAQFSHRAGSGSLGSLSGTIIKQAQATTTWFLYPGACADRQNGLPGTIGTWSPRTTPQADSLNGYTAGTLGPYGAADQSVAEILWHVDDNTLCTAGTNCPPALTGSRSLWCGKFDANYVSAGHYGYPNLTYQILYVDTGVHGGATYNLTFDYNFSSEFNYDFVYVIGGASAGGGVDPLGNSRAQMDNIIAAGGHQIEFTGSIRPGSPNATGGNTTGGLVAVHDNPGSPVTVTGASFVLDGASRAVYFIFKADCLFSTEDGLWPEGHGEIIDNLGTSDNGSLYTEQVPPVDPIGGGPLFDTTVSPPGGGVVLRGTAGAPILSARVAPGVGTLWQLVAGNNLPTPDICSPQKLLASDLEFEGGNAATFHTVANQFNSIVTCTFPIPAGTANVTAFWNEYLDLPRFQGYVQYAEFRIHKDGSWGNWDNTTPGGGVTTGALQAWRADGDELAAATQADSVQIRYNIQCINFFAADHNNCGDVAYGVIYDDFRLEIVTGVPAPVIGVFVGAVGQSTFVDGTMSGANCSAAQVTAGQCWPGVRGSNITAPVGQSSGAVVDNFNSPLGDSITLGLVTGLRKGGKGINWHHGFNKSVNFGLSIAHTNPNYNTAFDKPRVIYRLFDPTSKTWSPFDSSELDANAVSIAAGDTTLIDSEFRMNWPPRDKASASLPGGFTVNGKSLYSQLAFLPRGSRLQYYWKAVDINGGTTYQFSTDALAREVDELPTLPGGTIVAPDIIDFRVLPGAYAAGAAGTQLAGRTTTPLLDLDGSYSRWNFATHATTQALRALGVRADRYRPLQGLEEGGHIGGHEFAGTRAGRLSNYFPNMDEYSIRDSLALWYRIMIESSHTSTTVVDEESDSKLISDWWASNTGTDGGDRCIFASGDDFFTALLAIGGVPHPFENSLSNSVLGVAAVANAWNGTATNQFPNIRDLFADPAAGPGLGTGTFTYPIDGGCPGPNRFDALTRVGGADAQDAALYPTVGGITNASAVRYMTERDTPTDHDRNKSLAYGYSIQFIRTYGENFVDTRAQVLYKFLTSCRGPRTTADTASCWPCPTDANKYTNWATSANFATGTYGPLYPLQDATRVVIGVDPGIAAAPPANRLQGNFPNPFNPHTAIRFSAAHAGRVDVRIFDVAGRLVQTITKNATQGVNEVRWNGQSSDGKNLASGVYFVKVKYPDGSESLNGLKVAIVR